MKNQKAVEWLAKKIEKLVIPTGSELAIKKLVEKAKEMEKHQRQEDANYGYSQGWADGNEAKEPMKPTCKLE